MASENIRVVSWLEKLLEPVVKKRFHLDRKITVKEEMTNSSATPALLETADNALGDQICLVLPFGDTSVSCTLSFCWLDPTIPPVVAHMNDLDYLETTPVHLLDFEWNPYENADCLLNFVMILLADYRSYNLTVCQKFGGRVYTEIQSLRKSSLGFDALENSDGRSVTFVVYSRATRLENLMSVNNGEDEFVIVFDIRNNSIPQAPAIHLSTYLQELFDAKSAPVIPPVGSIVYYEKLMNTAITAAVNLAHEALKINHQLVTNVIDWFSSQLLDWSPTFGRTAGFLLGKDSNYRVALRNKGNVLGYVLQTYFSFVSVEFPLRYPGRHIKLHFSSVYQEKDADHHEPVQVMVPLLVKECHLDQIAPELHETIKKKLTQFKVLEQLGE